MKIQSKLLYVFCAAGAAVALAAATNGLSVAEADTAPLADQPAAAIEAPKLSRRVEQASVTPNRVTLPAGTRLVARTTNTLSTKSHRPGDTFVAYLDEPVELNGRTIAPRGSRVVGMVAEADKGGRVKGRAQLAVRLIELETDHASYDLVTAARSVTAETTKKKDLKRGGIATGIGAAIGAISGGGKGALVGAGVGGGAATGAILATHGNPAVIPSESVLRFTLSHDAVP